MRRILPLGLFAALAAMASPVAHAQKAPTGADKQVAAPDPARLEVATRVVAKLLPAGVMKKMMDTSLGPMMDQMMGAAGDMKLADIARVSGVEQTDVADLGEGTLRDIMAVYDPYWDQRTKLATTAMTESMSEMMAEIEPAMRSGLARAYAREFTLAELAEMDRFFSTPTGAHYAEKSYALYVDPEMMTAIMAMMPKIMERLPEMMKSAEAATAHLPKPRTNADLTPDERKKLAGLLGVPEAALTQDAKAEQ